MDKAVMQDMDERHKRERVRAEILAAVDAAETSLSRGEGRVITRQSMQELAGRVKQRGRSPRRWN